MNTLTTDRASRIGAVLEAVVTLSRAVTAPRTTPFGDAILTRTQLEILFLLAHAEQPVTPGRLASTLRVTPGAITQTMDQLRERGLAEKSVSDDDGRVRVWTLTETAAAQVVAFESAAVLRAAPWFAELTGAELDRLAGLLRRVEVP